MTAKKKTARIPKKEKKKEGRPSKLPAIDLNQVENIAALGLTDVEIAMVLSISKSTLNAWKDNADFLDSLKRGKLKADMNVTQSLYRKATGGDTVAQIFWLKNRRRQDWRDKQDLGIDIPNDGDQNAMTDKDLETIIRSAK